MPAKGTPIEASGPRQIVQFTPEQEALCELWAAVFEAELRACSDGTVGSPSGLNRGAEGPEARR